MPKNIRKGLCAMIFRATEEIADRFESDGIKCDIHEEEHTSTVLVGVDLDNTGILIRFISADDDNDVAIRVYHFAQVPKDHTAWGLLAVNKLNDKYRFVTFTFDSDDHSIDIRADLLVTTVDVGDAATEMLARLVKICDEAYPELMKAIWSE